MQLQWITVLEKDNEESPNVGTLQVNSNVKQSFKQAVEDHFDAELVKYSFDHPEIENLTDCISGCPIDVTVVIDADGIMEEYKLLLSQTIMYG
jgi:hypothetical protein